MARVIAKRTPWRAFVFLAVSDIQYQCQSILKIVFAKETPLARPPSPMEP
jgi:hypothetical protein